VEVPARHHTRLIGRRGAVISKVRSDNDVQVVFPERVSDRPDIITVIGLEENARKARDEIRDKVRELVCINVMLLLFCTCVVCHDCSVYVKFIATRCYA